MASVVKTSSGSTYTFTITDMAGSVATLVQTQNPITGTTIQFSGASVRIDAIAAIQTLVTVMESGLVPSVLGN